MAVERRGGSGRATRGCRGDVQTERTAAEYRLLFASRLYKSFDTQHKSIEGVMKNARIDV